MIRWLADKIYEKTGIELSLGDITFDEQAQMLVATVLAASAAADSDHHPSEAVEIIAILRQEYGRNADSAIELLADAANRLSEGDAVEDMFKEVRSRLTLAQREALMANILRVVAADRRRAPSEWRFIDMAAERLAISDASMARALSRYRDTKRSPPSAS